MNKLISFNLLSVHEQVVLRYIFDIKSTMENIGIPEKINKGLMKHNKNIFYKCYNYICIKCDIKSPYINEFKYAYIIMDLGNMEFLSKHILTITTDAFTKEIYVKLSNGKPLMSLFIEKYKFVTNKLKYFIHLNDNQFDFRLENLAQSSIYRPYFPDNSILFIQKNGMYYWKINLKKKTKEYSVRWYGYEGALTRAIQERNRMIME